MPRTLEELDAEMTRVAGVVTLLQKTVAELQKSYSNLTGLRQMSQVLADRRLSLEPLEARLRAAEVTLNLVSAVVGAGD